MSDTKGTVLKQAGTKAVGVSITGKIPDTDWDGFRDGLIELVAKYPTLDIRDIDTSTLSKAKKKG